MSSHRPRRDWRAVAAFGIALLFIAAVRLLVPADQLTTIDVRPGADGWASSRDGEGRLLEATLVERARSGQSSLISTGDVLVVTLEVSARTQTVDWDLAELHTRDGQVVWAHAGPGFERIPATNPGFVQHLQVAFTTSKGAWRGAVVVVAPRRSDGIVALREQLVLPVPEPGHAREIKVGEPETRVR